MKLRERKRKPEYFQKKSAKNMKLGMKDLTDSVGDEQLKKILSYVPVRRFAAQVNKQWYRVVCALDDDEEIYKLNLDGADGIVRKYLENT